MLVTKQPVLRRFWYPVMPIARLKQQPQPFTLLEQPLVLWLQADGSPSALADRCCHRSAQLSKGPVVEGAICCPYHGWRFDAEGVCVQVPQLATVPASYRVPAYRCQERYGYVWVCLDEPLTDIPSLPEASHSDFRLMYQLDEPWKCSGLRIMENSVDMAHLSFVHANTFGNINEPVPPDLDIQEADYEITVIARVPVVNPLQQQRNLRLPAPYTTQTNTMVWFMPFVRKLTLTYVNGVIRIIFTAATPIDDQTSQVLQFCLSNDREEEVKESDITAWERQIAVEDRAILESTTYDTPLNLEEEVHMASDRPGMLMRRKLAALLRAHGEVEQRQAAAQQLEHYSCRY